MSAFLEWIKASAGQAQTAASSLIDKAIYKVYDATEMDARKNNPDFKPDDVSEAWDNIIRLVNSDAKPEDVRGAEAIYRKALYKKQGVQEGWPK